MIGIFVICITVGFSYIFIGFLVKKNPTLIAGYNKSDEYQQKILPDFLTKALSITGIVTIFGCFISVFLKWDIGVPIFLILPSMIMIFTILIKEKRNENKKITKIMMLFFVILAILIPTFIAISSKEPSIIFGSENIKITGLYGETIPIKDITEVTILNDIPTIQLRTNGFALGAVRKGYCLMEGMGTVKLFLNSKSAPYIKLQTIENKCIILNCEDNTKTIDAYNKIKSYHE